MVTAPPASPPLPCTVKGSAFPSIEAPRWRSASSTVSMGRSLALGSPSKRTSPSASTAAGGTNRITVPARPQSTSACPVSPACGPMTTWSPPSSTGTPSARSASIISLLSRLRSAPVSVPPPSASAASNSARLVIDFEPGTATVAVTGPVARGAAQCWSIRR
jgi:hypothetical protein